MKTLLILRGIPASGKSTYAEKILNSNPNLWKRINMDSLRFMATNYVYSTKNEKYISDLKNSAITMALKNDFNVISDDTNLRSKTVRTLHDIAKTIGNVIVIEKYFDITKDEAIRRDSVREKKVGSEVIEKFYNKYINKNLIISDKIFYPKKSVVKIKQNKILPKCIIVDIDGTIAKMNNRNPYDFLNVYQDVVNEPIKLILDLVENTNRLNENYIKIIFLSGRDSIARDETIRWIKNKVKLNTFNPDEQLFMRAKGDSRKDSIIKLELYKAHIENKYNVLFILDDRDQVVKLWRDIGLTCLQVDWGSF